MNKVFFLFQKYLSVCFIYLFGHVLLARYCGVHRPLSPNFNCRESPPRFIEMAAVNNKTYRALTAPYCRTAMGPKQKKRNRLYSQTLLLLCLKMHFLLLAPVVKTTQPFISARDRCTSKNTLFIPICTDSQQALSEPLPFWQAL